MVSLVNFTENLRNKNNTNFLQSLPDKERQREAMPNSREGLDDFTLIRSNAKVSFSLLKSNIVLEILSNRTQ